MVQRDIWKLYSGWKAKGAEALEICPYTGSKVAKRFRHHCTLIQLPDMLSPPSPPRCALHGCGRVPAHRFPHIWAVYQAIYGFYHLLRRVIHIHNTTLIVDIHERPALRTEDRFCRPDVLEEFRGRCQVQIRLLRVIGQHEKIHRSECGGDRAPWQFRPHDEVAGLNHLLQGARYTGTIRAQ